MPGSFNLIEEPFLPCVRRDGQAVEYGLRAAVTGAHEIIELRHRSPLVTVALYRLLLTVVHAAYRGPVQASDRKKLCAAGRFDPAVLTAYFARWADRFDLFHPMHPFYQRAGFEQAAPSGVNRLAQELSRGNNAALFDHTTDDPPPTITPAEAARLVVAEQAFAVGGGKSDTGNTTHAPLASCAAVLAVGDTLFQTLWLNLLCYDGEGRPVACDGADAPVWEREPSPPYAGSPLPSGYLDYLTWQSRTLLLHPEEQDGRAVVRRVSYSQGRKFAPTNHFPNPMAGYARKDAKEPWLTVRFNEYRDLWRDSTALYRACGAHESAHEMAPTTLREIAGLGLAAVLPAAARYRLAVFGLCTDKAKVNFWRHESLPLPIAYLDTPGLVEHLARAVKLAEAVAADALRKAAWAAAAARLTGEVGTPDADRVRAFVDSFAPDRLYWSRLDAPYRALLVRLADAADVDRPGLVADWFHETLVPAARHAFDGTLGRIEGGRSYKAAETGRRVLAASLARVRSDHQIPDREPQEGAA